MLLKHKYLFIGLMLLTFTAFNIPAYAQAAARLDSLKNKFALQFQIFDFIRLSSFQGTTFSGKYNIGNRNALRAGLSVDWIDSEEDYNETYQDTSLVYDGSTDTNEFGITLRLQYLYYIPSSYNISFFAGGGPFVRYASGTQEITNTSVSPEFVRKDSFDSISTGIDFLIGAEWFFEDYMSLSAEYGLKFQYFTLEANSVDNYRKVDSERNSIQISRGDLNFGLTVYF